MTGLSPPKAFRTERERQLWDALVRHNPDLTPFDVFAGSLLVTLLARFETRPSDFDPELVAELRLLAEYLKIDYRRVLMHPVNPVVVLD
jgi:hypothetical protein